MKIKNFSPEINPTNIIIISAFLIVLSIPGLICYVNNYWPNLTLFNFFESIINFSKACFEFSFAMWVLFILGPIVTLGLLALAIWERNNALKNSGNEFDVKFIDINKYGVFFGLAQNTGKFFRYEEIFQITLDVKTYQEQGKNYISDIVYRFLLPGHQIYTTHSVYANPFKALKYLRKIQNIKVSVTGSGGLEYNKKIKESFEYFIQHGKMKPLDKKILIWLLIGIPLILIIAIFPAIGDIVEFIILRF